MTRGPRPISRHTAGPLYECPALLLMSATAGNRLWKRGWQPASLVGSSSPRNSVRSSSYPLPIWWLERPPFRSRPSVDSQQGPVPAICAVGIPRWQLLTRRVRYPGARAGLRLRFPASTTGDTGRIKPTVVPVSPCTRSISVEAMVDGSAVVCGERKLGGGSGLSEIGATTSHRGSMFAPLTAPHPSR